MEQSGIAAAVPAKKALEPGTKDNANGFGFPHKYSDGKQLK